MARTSVALLIVFLGSALSRTARTETVVLHKDESPPDDPCRDDSDVVGHRRCPRYGLWGASLEAPYMFAAVGMSIRSLPRISHASGGVVPVSARMTTAPLDNGADSSLSYVERFSVAVSPALYFGIEAEIGFSDRQRADPDIRRVRAGGVGLSGLRVGSGPFSLGVELAGGARVVESGLGHEMVTDPVFETRLVADVWLTPWVTFGGAVGASLLERGDRMVGLYLGVHTYSFGGH